MVRQSIGFAVGLLVVCALFESAPGSAGENLSSVERLGKALFNDRNLSSPSGQACNACHGKQVGYSGPVSRTNKDTAVYPGALAGRWGNRKPPAASYAGDVPPLTFDEATSTWSGGLFLDGRATGDRLGDPLAEQALGPFLNPLEQNNASAASVCETVAESSYRALFESVWGPGSLDCLDHVDETYDRIGISIAAFERSAEVSPYTSKFDLYLAGETALTAEELRGFALFEGKADCASCHTVEVDAEIGHPTFSSFEYANMGVPRNESNPFYAMSAEWNPDGDEWVDTGLGGSLRNLGYPETTYQSEWGKFRIPTVRNVDRRPGPGFTKAFGHNGFFKSIEELVHFFNTRDVAGEGWMGTPWPQAEVSENISYQVGELGLSTTEETELVAFLRTLSDGYVF